MNFSALVASNHVLAPLFKYSEDPVLLMKDNLFIGCNSSVLSVLQLSSEEEFLNLHPGEISPEYQPDGSNSYQKSEFLVAQCYAEGFARFNWVHLNNSQQPFLVEVSIVNITLNKEHYILATWRKPDTSKNPSSYFNHISHHKLSPSSAETLPSEIQQTVDNYKLLDEHKKAIDASSIVSKTDRHGKITYVNDNFCNVSGYSCEELLGHSHNIVNHPDMPASAFTEMWQTILSGNVWRGVIKNKKKSGEIYYVDSCISPIKGQNGEINEFIAIRSDITEIFEKDEIIHFLNIDTVTQLDNRAKLDSDISTSDDCCLALILVP